MAAGDQISADRIIYRALPYRHINKKTGKAKDSAFILKEAHTNEAGQQWPAEDYLSFGIDPAYAKAGLQNIPYTCGVLVGDILALGRNLRVVEDVDGKVQVSGMPLQSQDLEMSVTIAKDLRNISRDYE